MAAKNDANANSKDVVNNGKQPIVNNVDSNAANGGATTDTPTNNNDNGEEDLERKKNLDPNNPYRQQWVEYYAHSKTRKSADAAAASNTDNSSSARNTIATNDNMNVNSKNGVDNGNQPAANNAAVTAMVVQNHRQIIK